jgi:hypothetical protein
MTTRHNHYVPRFYLNMFASSPGLIFVYDKRQQVVRDQPTKETAVERDLYTAVSPTGELIDDIETELFSPIEETVAPLLKSLAKREGQWPKGTAQAIGWFMATLYARVPRTIDTARELARISMIEYQKMLAADPERLQRLHDDYIRDNPCSEMLSVEEMTKYLSDPEKYFKVSFSRKHALAMCLMNIDVTLEVLPQLRWAVCRNYGAVPFITSDCPVVSFAPTGTGQVVFNAYWYSPDLEVSFPISPHVCMFLRRKPQQVNRAVSNDFVREINRRTAFVAERFVYSSLSCAYLDRLVSWAEKRRPASWVDVDEARRLAYRHAAEWPGPLPPGK